MAGPATRRRRRRLWRLGFSLALFALTAAALLAASALILRTLDAERAEREQIRQTDAVLVALNDIGRAAINAETGQRGYFITLDRSYLTPYELARHSYPLALRRLRRLLGGGPDERVGPLLAALERAAAARFEDLDRSVALIGEGRILDAQQGILSDDGLQLMARLRATLRELERIERQRLDESRLETAALEARIPALLAALLAFVCGALALGLWQVARAARAETQAAQAEELAEARDRADLLARELNHRVKNLFMMVLGIVRMSGRDHPEAKPVVESIAQRIHALVTAHEVTQGTGQHASVELRELIEKAIAPYCSADQRCEVAGGGVTLPGEMAVPLGMVIHELVTNAVKYGAWSAPGGLLEVGWRREAGKLLVSWREHGNLAVAPDVRRDRARGRGFGSVLIESSARQLGGSIRRIDHPDGIAIEMSLPLA